MKRGDLLAKASNLSSRFSTMSRSVSKLGNSILSDHDLEFVLSMIEVNLAGLDDIINNALKQIR